MVLHDPFHFFPFLGVLPHYLLDPNLLGFLDVVCDPKLEVLLPVLEGVALGKRGNRDLDAVEGLVLLGEVGSVEAGDDLGLGHELVDFVFEVLLVGEPMGVAFLEGGLNAIGSTE